MEPSIAIVSNDASFTHSLKLPLIELVHDNGISVHTIHAPGNLDSENKLQELGCEIHHVPLFPKSYNIFLDGLFVKKLFSILRQTKPKALFTCSLKSHLYGIPLAKLLNIPVVPTFSGLGRMKDNSYIQQLYRLLLPFSSAQIFVNKGDCNLMVEKRLVDCQKTFVLPGEGVDHLYFQRTTGYPNNVVHNIVYMSRIMPEKGIDVFLQVAQLFEDDSNVQFHVMGPVDPFSDIKEKNCNRKNVKFHGNLTDVKPCLETTSCVILPTRYGEGMPRCLLEALSYQIPIITTDIAGCKELLGTLEDPTGLSCGAGTTNELLEAIKKFISLSTEAKIKMGVAGRNLIMNHYTQQHIFGAYQNFFDSYGTHLSLPFCSGSQHFASTI